MANPSFTRLDSGLVSIQINNQITMFNKFAGEKLEPVISKTTAKMAKAMRDWLYKSIRVKPKGLHKTSTPYHLPFTGKDRILTNALKVGQGKDSKGRFGGMTLWVDRMQMYRETKQAKAGGFANYDVPNILEFGGESIDSRPEFTDRGKKSNRSKERRTWYQAPRPFMHLALLHISQNSKEYLDLMKKDIVETLSRR
jgi:hypothetical protein